MGNGADNWQVVGDPAEGALVVAALKAGIEANNHHHRFVHQLPFDSERKAMSVVMPDLRGQAVMYTKGAPEVILAKCSAELRESGCNRRSGVKLGHFGDMANGFFSSASAESPKTRQKRGARPMS